MAGNAFTNLSTLSLSDNFRSWFDKTNEIVETLNPVEVYGVTPGSGITVAIDASGIATVGLSLPASVPGNAGFTGSITFSNEVRFTGKTVDVSGSTVYGNVVRTVNGSTGDVTIALTGANDSTSTTGDILIKTGGTLAAYTMFQGFTLDGNRSFRFSGSGGMLIGGSGGITGMNHIGTKFRLGSLAIAGGLSGAGDAGVTAAFLQFLNLGYTGSDNAERGMQVYYGRINNGNTDALGLVVKGGGTNGDFDSDGPMLVVDSTNRRFGLNGVTSAQGGLHIKTISTSTTAGNDILLEDSAGKTIPIRTVINGSTTEYNGKEGIVTSTGARFRGFANQSRLRTITNAVYTNVGVELRHSSTPSSFSVLGQESSGASLSPALVVKGDGSVIIGGVSGGESGSTFGALNIVSGEILLGGTHGVTLTENGGVQTILSGMSGGGISNEYKVILAPTPDGGTSTSLVTNIEFAGNITDDIVSDIRRTSSTAVGAEDEFGTSIPFVEQTFLEFFDYSGSNKRHAVGNFEIEVTMPVYEFVYEKGNFALSRDFDEPEPIIGVVAFVDDNKTNSVSGNINNGAFLANPSKGVDYIMLKDILSTDLKGDVLPKTDQLKFTVSGNCAERVKLGIFASGVHAHRGQRCGAIYKSPGSYKARFFNVE